MLDVCRRWMRNTPVVSTKSANVLVPDELYAIDSCPEEELRGP